MTLHGKPVLTENAPKVGMLLAIAAILDWLIMCISRGLDPYIFTQIILLIIKLTIIVAFFYNLYLTHKEYSKGQIWFFAITGTFLIPMIGSVIALVFGSAIGLDRMISSETVFLLIYLAGMVPFILGWDGAGTTSRSIFLRVSASILFLWLSGMGTKYGADYLNNAMGGPFIKDLTQNGFFLSDADKKNALKRTSDFMK